MIDGSKNVAFDLGSLHMIPVDWAGAVSEVSLHH